MVFHLLGFSLHLLLSTCFPAARLSASHVRADWLHDWSSAAKWPRLLLITYLVAPLSYAEDLSTMRAEPAGVIANRGLMN